MLWLTLVILVMVRRGEETRKSLYACCPSYSGLLGEVPGLWATLLQTGDAKFLKNVTWDCSPTSTCTHAHWCTDTHTQNMHIHMHANAQTHQFQNEIWVKIVKKKKSNTMKSQVLLSENYSIRSHKEETWQRTAYPSQCWANLPCHVQRHCSQL